MTTPTPTPTPDPTAESGGNRVTLFDDGAALFRDLEAAIGAARERVWIETFLFTPDAVGRRTLELASDAARRGCHVVLLFDQLGSHLTNLGAFAPLERAGGRVVIFNPLPPWRRYGRRLGSPLLHRNHRKNLVVDGAAWCGGHNFSGSYMGPPPHHFYDLTVKLEGPGVLEMARLLGDSYRRATGEPLPLPATAAVHADGASARALGHDAERGYQELVRAYEALLDGAREEAVLLFAYFVPDERLRAPLLRAARRGVRVRLLTAGKTDFPPLRLAGQHTYDELLRAGVRIWQLQEPVLHAKAMAVDGERSLVGSFDVNRLERENTMEVAVQVTDRALAAGIAGCFEKSLPRAREITLAQRERRSRLGRLAERWAYRAMGMGGDAG